MTLYVPGPVLHPGRNEVVLLELEAAPGDRSVRFTDEPDFCGPVGALRCVHAETAVPADRRQRVP